MKRYFHYIVVLSFVFAALAAAESLDLMPVPQKVTPGQGKFQLTADFIAAVSGPAAPRLYGAATRALRHLSGRTGLFFPQDFITAKDDPAKAQLLIVCQRPGKVQLGEDESYELRVAPEQITLSCVSDLGGLRGLETLLQLLKADDKGYYFPEIQIQDSPRFVWRGLMIDVCRHWLPVDVIKRNLDAMAAVKMNVFHWHLTEDQGFRIESKLLPELQSKGSDGFFFTQDQVRDIIQYADDRGIRVIPEFDMPGHATSWFMGHPELASAPGPYSIERRWGVFDPTMDPTRETTYRLLDKFLGEMAGLFPDPYMHIGGDENNGKQWNQNPSIQEFMKKKGIKDNHALQAYFNSRILKILTKHGKKMVGWDEILHEQMPTNIVIQSWRGPRFLVQSARKGYTGILSNGYYIDLIQPAEYHYLNDPVPPDSAMTVEEKARILGGEATSWAEYVTPETVDSRIWPRTAAIAERLWSAADVRDVEEMYRRMNILSFQLEELGLLHIKNYEMMLRRLTGDQDISALKKLVDVVEPVKIYQRGQQGVSYTQYSPMTRVVDATRPESMTARRFRQLTDQFIKTRDGESQAEMSQWLQIWRDNHASLLPVMQASPILWEMEGLSRDLSELAACGMELLPLWRDGKAADEGLKQRTISALAAAAKPRGQTELMVVKPIEKLFKAVLAN